MKPDPTTFCIPKLQNTMTSGKKVYISPVIDMASLEILACQVSYSPNMKLVYRARSANCLKQLNLFYIQIRAFNTAIATIRPS